MGFELNGLRAELRAVETQLASAMAQKNFSKKQFLALKAALVGRQGKISLLLKQLNQWDGELRKQAGALLNEAKQRTLQTLQQWEGQQLQAPAATNVAVDVALPGRSFGYGVPHPLREVERRVVDILTPLGFCLAQGPLIESEWYNFSALNVPAQHPARDMQDTFFVRPDVVLRTHTSSIQIRHMQQGVLPLRILAPGMVFRRDAADATHSPVFHQMEGLWLDERANFANLKGVLVYLLQGLFGSDCQVRLRPSYFPFTEPSCEVDVSCRSCSAYLKHNCRVCHGNGWLEVLGAGMVHPAVLEAAGLPVDKVQGFAFGLGLDRLAMLVKGIEDIRWLYENDLRFLADLHA